MDITTQQQLALDQLEQMYETTDTTGSALDAKASTILQSGSILIALVSALGFPFTVADGDISWIPVIGIAASLGIFAYMLYLTLKAWKPQVHEVPGKADVDDVFDNFVNKNVDDAYNRRIMNLIDATSKNKEMNDTKAMLVSRCMNLFVLQIAVILVSFSVDYVIRILPLLR